MEKDVFSIQGKCMEMCPKEEIEMREKEKLLHILEIVPGTERHKFPKASLPNMVKAFSRSAAGKKIKVENLRPPEVLLRTVRYLLCDVIQTKKVQWNVAYDFITDRLMAVRQDMVVQNISKSESITILQPIVRFHAYAAYKLCQQSITTFDPTLNNNHLQECLKKLLHIYDSYDCIINLERENSCVDYLLENRPQFEALYLIFNIGNDEALRRFLTIPKPCKTKIVQTAANISFYFKCGNFVRLCRVLLDLPPLLAAIGSLHLPEIRRRAFQTMSNAYHSKNLSFPLKILQEILLYKNVEDLEKDCTYYDVKCRDGGVFFNKQEFNGKIAVSARHESFVDEKCLEKNVHSILLGL